MRRYKLVEENVIPLLGIEPEANIEIAEEEVDGVPVCTKFLGYSLSNVEPPPDVFETMIYQNPPPYPRWRYGTLSEAMRGHAEIVARLRRESLRIVP